MASAETIRYTTDVMTITLRDLDLTNHKVLVTVSQGSANAVTITNPPRTVEDGDTTLYVSMTQQQSGALTAGRAKMQVNWIDSNGNRGATDTIDVVVGENLLPEVISYA
jgi:hypothetical protein